jgi:uncharacterized repeat protein (TIGR03803 family)
MRRLSKFAFPAAILMLWLVAPWVRGDVAFTTLVSFNGAKGANPVPGLVPGTDGNFYGTTLNGGAYSNGTIFAISPDGTFFTNLYNFSGGSNGAGPMGGLILCADGNFYGTTYGGGVSNWGTMFRISTNGVFSNLGFLSGTNGANPDVALVQAPDGSFYGGAKYGGPYPNTTQGGTGYGSIFKITTNGVLSTPVLFDSTNGANPSALVLGRDGNFYGTTTWGGNISGFKLGFGTIFRLSPDGTFTNLYKFTGGNDGGFPQAPLVQGTDGIFYGTTQSGGSNQIGTVFKITPDGQFKSLISFPNSDTGSYPHAAMVQGSDGNFYGTTYIGGSNQLGSVFQITPDGHLTQIFSFTGGSGSHLGANPQGPVVQGTDGNFYGVAYNGGLYSSGTVFRLSLPLAPVIQSITKTAGTVTLTWNSVAGQTYLLEYCTDLAQGYWSNVGNAVMATNGMMTGLDPAATDPQRFYRVAVGNLVRR